MSLHHQAKSHTNPTMSLQAKRRKHQPCPSSDPPPPIIQRLNPRPIYINSEGDSNSPICHGCHAPITGDLVKALGKAKNRRAQSFMVSALYGFNPLVPST